MQREVGQRFERIESLLHAMAGRENQIEIRFNRRMDRADQRMEKFDRQLDATRKLVQAGMKIVIPLAQRQKAADEEMKELRHSLRDLQKSQKAFLDSLNKGGNGFRRAG